MLGRLDVLTSEQVNTIHDESLRVLEETGIKFWDPKAAKILDDAGANWNRSTNVVKIPPNLVRESLKKCPKRITLAGRDKKHDLVLEPGKTYFGTLGTAPLVLDLETRKRRLAVTEDLEKFARIADALESVRYFHTSVTASDVPPRITDIHRWATAFRNTEKHAMGGVVYTLENMPYLIRILQAVAGGEEELRKRPIITATECPVPPLQHDKRPLCGIMRFAELGLPVIIYSEPKAGATSPASLAGTLVVTNSEVLSGIVLMQLVNSGCPAIYGSVATLMDMRSGGIAFGSPETALLAAATSQIARHYGIPNMTPGGRTDSKVPCDAQTGYEKMRTALMIAMAGGNLGNMAGLIESNLVASYEQLIVDDEIIGTIERLSKGIEFDKDALVVDLIKKVGPGGTYISQRHTLDRLKKEHYMPRISDRTFYSGWQRNGAKQLADVAREKAKKLLDSHEPAPLDKSVDRELKAILKEASRNS